MLTTFIKLKPITMFGILYLVGIVVILLLLEDELPFLHPGKVHVYVALDEDVTRAFVGRYELNTSGLSHTLWVKPGSYDVRVEVRGRVHNKTVTLESEAYILLDGKPPYIHGFD